MAGRKQRALLLQVSATDLACARAGRPCGARQVAKPDREALPLENGIIARNALLRQASNARELIEKHSPDRIVILGGDCLVDLAPFAVL